MKAKPFCLIPVKDQLNSSQFPDIPVITPLKAHLDALTTPHVKVNIHDEEDYEDAHHRGGDENFHDTIIVHSQRPN